MNQFDNLYNSIINEQSKEPKEWSLWDDDPSSVYAPNGEVKQHVAKYFELQDKMALKSEVFKRILQQEIKTDPQERYESTNDPKSKTRNALLLKHAYYRTNPNPKKKGIDTEKVFHQKEWEDDLLSSSFYGANL